MKNNQVAATLLNTVNELNLSQDKLLDHLPGSAEPVIYLCGKSSSGKTTFLNAVLNRERDEFLEGTNISTASQFRFMHGSNQTYLLNDGVEQPVPEDINERKNLFRQLNTAGSYCTIRLNEKALEGRTIVDIPGVLDFTGNTSFTENLMAEADIVFFFSPTLGKVSNPEYEVLKTISEAEIPLVVLFTMADITEPDEGITRQTMPDHIANRLKTCFSDINVTHYQLISSADFFKGKDTHGLSELLSLMHSNELELLKKASDGRLKRALVHYTGILSDKITDLETENSTHENLLKRETDLKYSAAARDLENQTEDQRIKILNELSWLKNTIQTALFKSLTNNGLTSSENLKHNFKTTWESFWHDLQQSHPNLITTVPTVPMLDAEVFRPLEVNVEKMAEIKKFFNKIKDKDDEQDSNKAPGKKNSSSTEAKASLLDILVEMGLNLKNATLLYEKWKTWNQIEKQINGIQDQIVITIKSNLENQKTKLQLEKEESLQTALHDNPIFNNLERYKLHLMILSKEVNGL